MDIKYDYTGLEIAVIGMSGRFPGASDLHEYWDNIRRGLECISYMTDEELLKNGIDPQVLKQENYVKAKGIFPDVEYFDYDFFKYTPKDAAVMDPQVRALHQEVYHALEDAGYISEQYRGNIGLFLGASGNFKWEAKTLQSAMEASESSFAASQLNDKDFAATRIAYALNLKGPCMVLHSACSSSLLAIDVACRNLLTGSCRIAVAGGSSISLPNKKGYEYVKGMIYSPDGHCRPFDENAQGTVEGNGAGAVVLKNLDDALRDGDYIYAVIKGTAANNDGNRKVGFTAPSVEGQAEAIRQALSYASVNPETVTYVETHGTGTELGDPIEFEGLCKAFQGVEKENCALGSVKAGIGHLDTAAGVAAFEKVVLALKNQTIPKSINFQTINPYIDLENSPFYFCSESREWNRLQSEEELIPRRAGVSSFGMGGTNVHIVMEEAPMLSNGGIGRKNRLFTLSANSETAIQNMQKQYLLFLKEQKNTLNLDDFIWSLQMRQRSLTYRYTTVFDTVDELLEQLESCIKEEKTCAKKAEGKHIYFMFSGQGTQYPGMGKELYESEPKYRESLDECIEIAQKYGFPELRMLLLEPVEGDSEKICQTQIAQIALFSVEYAIANMLMSWGITPDAMIGHSLGEFVAATISNVFTLEDGIRVIIERGRNMQKMKPGAMLGVNASKEQIESFLGDKVNIAAINTREQLTVSGSEKDLKKFAVKCSKAGILTKKLHTSHAFHSYMMHDAVEPFTQMLNTVEKGIPEIPFISNITGEWIEQSQAVSSEYYASQLVSSVNFLDGCSNMFEKNAIAIEIGPGKVLSGFVKANCRDRQITTINVLPHAKEAQPADQYFTKALGNIWAAGAAIQWHRYDFREDRQRIPLPLYAFDKTEVTVSMKESYMKPENLEPHGIQQRVETERIGQTKFYTLGWKKTMIPEYSLDDMQKVFLVITDDVRIQEVFRQIPRQRAIVVKYADDYSYQKNGISSIRSKSMIDIRNLIRSLDESAMIPDMLFYYSENDEVMMEESYGLVAVLSEKYQSEVSECIFVSREKNHERCVEKACYINALNMMYPSFNIRILFLPDVTLEHKRQLLFSEIIKQECGLTALTTDNAVRYEGKKRYSLMPECLEEVDRKQEENLHCLVVAPYEKIPETVRLLESAEGRTEFELVTYKKRICNAFSTEEFEQITAVVNTMEENLFLKSGLSNFNRFYEKAEKYAGIKILQFVRTVIGFKEGQTLSKDNLMDAFKPVSGLERYVDYFLKVMEDEKYMVRMGDSYLVTNAALEDYHADEIRTDIACETKLFEGQLNLFDYVLDNLKDALSGEKIALGVLYPPEQPDFLVKMHEGSIQNLEDGYLMDLLYETVRELIKGKKRIRILEAGAGYGTILRKLAPLFKNVEVEFYFTDLGNNYLDLFMSYAIQEELDFVRFCTLDIEKEPSAQGLELESFDLVLAYNVLHATFSIENAVENMMKLLKPGGMIGVIERTKVRRYVDTVWGLADGWWYFDEKERNLSPIIGKGRWLDIMKKKGVSEVNIFPYAENLSHCVDASFILGQKEKCTEEVIEVSAYQGEKEKYPIIRNLLLDENEAVNRQNVKNIFEWYRKISQVILMDYQKMFHKPEMSSGLEKAGQLLKSRELETLFFEELEKRKIPCNCLSILSDRDDRSQMADWMILNSQQDNGKNITRLYVDKIEDKLNYPEYLLQMKKSGVPLAVYTNRNLSSYFRTAKKRREDDLKSEKTDNVEQMLLDEWKKLFGLSAIGLDDDFFDIGGDSFKLIQMTNDMEKKGYKILMNEVYSYPTIHQLADYIRMNQEQKTEKIEMESQIIKSVSEWFHLPGRFISGNKGGESKRILLVGNAENVEEISKKLTDADMDNLVYPDYILPIQNGMRDEEYEMQINQKISKEQIERMLIGYKEMQKKYAQNILLEKEIYRYPISNMQRIHFKGDTRLQMYLIEFNQKLDIEVLNRAFTDIVAAHGFLRSSLTGVRLSKWSEKEIPAQLKIPMIDLKLYGKQSQDAVVKAIVDYENTADFKCRNQVMYHVCLVKYSEKKYDMLFQFDHSVFDLFSGQLIRMQLMRRYNELKNGTCSAMKLSCNYKHYMDQIRKGPIGITPDEFRKKFEIGLYGEAFTQIQNKIAEKRLEKNRQVTCSVDVSELLEDRKDTDSLLEIAVELSGMTLARILDVDSVAIDLLFQNRKYGKRKFNDVMGMAVDGIPLVFDITEESLDDMTRKLKTKLTDISKFNINFFNLVCDVKSFLKWGRVMQEVNNVTNSKMFASCLINFAGNVESEYDRIWEYSSDDSEESSLNYADYYVAVKSIDTRLEFHIICSFESDTGRISEIMKEQADILKKIKRG